MEMITTVTDLVPQSWDGLDWNNINPSDIRYLLALREAIAERATLCIQGGTNIYINRLTSVMRELYQYSSRSVLSYKFLYALRNALVQIADDYYCCWLNLDDNGRGAGDYSDVDHDYNDFYSYLIVNNLPDCFVAELPGPGALLSDRRISNFIRNARNFINKLHYRQPPSAAKYRSAYYGGGGSYGSGQQYDEEGDYYYYHDGRMYSASAAVTRALTPHSAADRGLYEGNTADVVSPPFWVDVVARWVECTRYWPSSYNSNPDAYWFVANTGQVADVQVENPGALTFKLCLIGRGRAKNYVGGDCVFDAFGTPFREGRNENIGTVAPGVIYDVPGFGSIGDLPYYPNNIPSPDENAGTVKVGFSPIFYSDYAVNGGLRFRK